MSKGMLNKRPHLIPSLIASIMSLALALALLQHWSNNYFRGCFGVLGFICIIGVALYVSRKAYQWEKMWVAWLFGFIAFLWLEIPFMNKLGELLQLIAIICAVLFAVIAFVLRKPVEEQNAPRHLREGFWERAISGLLAMALFVKSINCFVDAATNQNGGREKWANGIMFLFISVVLGVCFYLVEKGEKHDKNLGESEKSSNEEIISIYKRIKEAVPSYDEPNYTLAEKVFREFNDFNLKNITEINLIYHDYIPKSLLPYPKNYIKCAYYIFLEQAKKNKDLKMFNLIQEVGSSLFFNYPDYDKYKENLKKKKWVDDVLKDVNPNPRE